MSQSQSHKNEMLLSTADAAAFLRRLADQFEAGGLEFGEVTVETDGPVKVKQSVKTKSDRVSFKLKLKYETALTPELSGVLGELPDEEPEEDDAAAPPQTAGDAAAAAREEKPAESQGGDEKDLSYKTLKKRMGKAFKAFRKTLQEGGAPAPAELSAFARDCRLMATFPGKGDEHYPEFLRHTEELRAAAEAGDLEAVSGALAQLGAMKKACHSDYK